MKVKKDLKFLKIVLVVFCLISTTAIQIAGFQKLNVETKEIEGMGSSFDVFNWPMFQRDLTRTGYSPSPSPTTNNVIWTKTLLYEPSISSQTVALSDKVYACSYSGQIYCLNAYNGQEIWMYDTDLGTISSNPSVIDGKLYVGVSYPGAVTGPDILCLDANTGECIWDYETGSDCKSTPVVTYDGKAYFGCDDGKLYCFDSYYGTLLWTFSADYMIRSIISYSNGKLYFGSNDDNLYCIDANTGELIWSFTTGGNVFCAPIILHGYVYFGSTDTYFYCLDKDTGQIVWTQQLSDFLSVYGSPAIISDRLYLGYGVGLFCLNAFTGDVIWSNEDIQPWSSLIICNDKLYFSRAQEDKLCCYDRYNGNLIWDYETADDICSAPSVYEGKLYFGSNEGKIYCICDDEVGNPPNTPNKPSGPINGDVNLLYDFSTSATDPDIDQIKYGWDWNGDNLVDEWTNYYNSGSSCEIQHSFNFAGIYNVKVKAKDINNMESTFSEYLTVNIQDGDVTPPIVEITIPQDGETVSDLITVRGTAQAYEGSIDKVEIKIKDNPWEICQGTNTWSYNFDTKTVDDGSCLIKARSYDSNLVSEIFEINVIVDNDEGGHSDPVLSYVSGYPLGIDKNKGYPDSYFEFKIHYYDSDEDQPLDKNLYVKHEDESGYSSYQMNGNGFDSDYLRKLNFQKIGSYEYYFEFTDANGGDSRLPTYGSNNFQVEDIPTQEATKPNLELNQIWKYKVNKINIQLGNNKYAYGRIDNLELEVVDKNTDYYTIDFSGTFKGDIQFVIEIIEDDDDDEESDGINLTIPIENIEKDITGTFRLDEKTLGFERIETSLEIEKEINIFDFKTWYKIVSTLVISSNEPYDFFKFNIKEGETRPHDEVTVDYQLTTSLYKWKRLGKYWKELYTKQKNYGMKFDNHTSTCTDVVNDKFKVESNLDYGLYYWYDNNNGVVTETKGKIDFWVKSLLIDFEATLIGCPPNKPSIISGNTEPKLRKTYIYSARSNDPNEDQIQYGWDWDGDMVVDEWTRFYKSGELCIMTHKFKKEEINGEKIHVRARDNNQEISPWSDPYNIEVKSKSKNNFDLLINRIYIFKIFFNKILEKINRFY